MPPFTLLAMIVDGAESAAARTRTLLARWPFDANRYRLVIQVRSNCDDTPGFCQTEELSEQRGVLHEDISL